MSNIEPGRTTAPKPLRAGVVITVLVFAAVAFLIGIAVSDHVRALFRHAPSEMAEAGKAVQYYTCGMHPWVILPKPGDCPICHMKLVPLDPAKYTTGLNIDPSITQNIGVRIAPVASGPVTAAIRTVGVVDYDETRVRDVNLKVSGWVEKLYVNSVGQPVEKDQPLLELYSPDLYSAQVDYLLAFKASESAKNEGPGAELLAAARKRLEFYDISDEQITELEKSGKVTKTMQLRSPFKGTVVIKNVLDGQRVESGMQLLRIADLSRVWIMATIYEYQAPFIEEGQSATMSLPYIPGQTFAGKVAYIYPYLNQEQRQAKVRLEFDNPHFVLKPGMYANVELRRTLAEEHVLVPREALVNTGERQIAFVSLGQGKFEPRKVLVGVEAEGGMLEILDGLKPGEMVVTSGEFLLDSEARMREALAKMMKGTEAATQKTPSIPGSTSEIATLPDEAAKRLGAILDAYFAIGAKLADDSIEGEDGPARDIAREVDALVGVAIPEDAQFWQKHTEVALIGGKALDLAQAKDIESARANFADISVALYKLVQATGVPASLGKPVEALHCPMYRQMQGGTIWLQAAGDVKNPYYGKSMLECFDWRKALPVTGAKTPTSAPAAPAPSPSPEGGSMPGMPGM